MNKDSDPADASSGNHRRNHPGNHHGNHRALLTENAVAVPAPVDAIIVPTARPAPYLRTAMALAKLQRCPLVVLCSKLASADATARMAAPLNIEVIAVDVTDLRPGGLMPSLRTSAVLRGTRFDRHTDTSLKRNLGLLLAAVVGWERIVFLDDDITIPDPDDLNDAAGLVSRYAAVGLSNGGFPDNSVVCHAYSRSGGDQDTFIGGGALVIGSQSLTSFFPNIYNEDWFFLLDETRLRPSAVTGLAVQAPYEPFRDTTRARAEELGDSLAEGLFRLLDNGQRLTAANRLYWADFLHRRREFIDQVVGMAHDTSLPVDEKIRIVAALKAAKGRNLLISPELCVDFMRAWRADRQTWQQHLEGATRLYGRQKPEKLLADLGLMHRCRAVA